MPLHELTIGGGVGWGGGYGPHRVSLCAGNSRGLQKPVKGGRFSPLNAKGKEILIYRGREIGQNMVRVLKNLR